MSITAISTALFAVGALTLVLASLLVVGNRKLHVEEDPRIDEVEAMLPLVNCGACGYPGCRPFAEALVAGQTSPSKCTVSPESGRERIARYLGVDVGAATRLVARLACAGGTNVARNHAHYVGAKSCAAAAVTAGGAKGCAWGCLNLGDCVAVCDFDALHLNAHGLPVVDPGKCTACGDCVDACPKDLFSLEPVAHSLWVACKSQEAGDEILEECTVACTACGRCAADAPQMITMQHNLPVIDHRAPAAAKDPIARCPTGAIVRLRADGLITRGPAARPIIRQRARADAPT